MLISILVISGCSETNSVDKVIQKDLFDSESRILAANPMIAQWVNAVTATRITVESILPHSTDPHTYSPGAKDVAQIIESQYIFAIGLMYEGKWLTEILDNNPGINFVNLGVFVSPVEFNGHGHPEGMQVQNSGQYDPHFWFDPQRVSIAVGKIADVMSLIDPEGATYYQDNASEYKIVLDKLDQTIAEKIDGIAYGKRKIISEHESLGYLGERYDIDIIGAVISDLSSESGSTPKDIVAIIELIREHDVTVIFLEDKTNDKVAERVAEETGIKVVDGLSVEAIEDGQSYVDFMKHNINLIVSNLAD